MRALVHVPHHHQTESQNPGDRAVATIWLIFYTIALVVAVASPFVLGAIELAAR